MWVDRHLAEVILGGVMRGVVPSKVIGGWRRELEKKKRRTRKKQDERMKLRSQKDERSLEHSRVITRLLWNSSRSLKLEDDALSGCCSGGPVIPTENRDRKSVV